MAEGFSLVAIILIVNIFSLRVSGFHDKGTVSFDILVNELKELQTKVGRQNELIDRQAESLSSLKENFVKFEHKQKIDKNDIDILRNKMTNLEKIVKSQGERINTQSNEISKLRRQRDYFLRNTTTKRVKSHKNQNTKSEDTHLVHLSAQKVLEDTGLRKFIYRGGPLKPIRWITNGEAHLSSSSKFSSFENSSNFTSISSSKPVLRGSSHVSARSEDTSPLETSMALLAQQVNRLDAQVSVHELVWDMCVCVCVCVCARACV